MKKHSQTRKNKSTTQNTVNNGRRKLYILCKHKRGRIAITIQWQHIYSIDKHY